MIVSIHQPSYFPWLGLLNKIAKSDIFILLDEVQLSDGAYQHRNIFLDSNGNVKYLTIPILKKGYLNKVIKDIKINNSENWGKKHLKFLFFNYKKHPYFEEIFPEIEKFFFKNYDFLIDAIYESMLIIFKFFNINTQIIFQSELNYDKHAKKAELILELCKNVNAKIYLSGIGAKDYMEPFLNKFTSENIRVIWNNFRLFEYSQKNSISFVKGLSSLDMLFNLGIEKSRRVFWNKVKEEVKWLNL